MEMKKCNTCEIERKLNEFYSHSETKKKLATCKHCRRKYQKKYYKSHRDKVLENSKVYYQKNKEVMQEYNEEWRERNPERVKEYNRRLYGHRAKAKRAQSYA